ncbi:hypothetical protein C0995_003486 [Termitomyces sp. Mi166|nr:hypothetical protein C0995_003486 [Termitomyces sp. Mi166\
MAINAPVLKNTPTQLHASTRNKENEVTSVMPSHEVHKRSKIKQKKAAKIIQDAQDSDLEPPANTMITSHLVASKLVTIGHHAQQTTSSQHVVKQASKVSPLHLDNFMIWNMKIKQCGSYIHGEAKVKTTSIVETLYNFASSHSQKTIANNCTLAKNLKFEKGFIYKIECNIDKQSIRIKDNILFYVDDYCETYYKHIESLKMFEKTMIKYEMLDTLQKHLHNHGYLHFNAAPLAFKSCLAIPLTTFEAMIKEYQKNDETDSDGEITI